MNISKEILKYVDLLRGEMPIQESVQLFSVIAVMVKNDVDGISNLLRLNKQDTVDQLKLKTASDEKLQWFNSNLFTVSSAQLQEIIQFFVDLNRSNSDYEIQVFTMLKELYLSLKFESIDSEVISNIFKKMVGSCKGKTLYDGACGLGVTSIALQAEKTILRDINTTTTGIASILADLASMNVDIKRSDSLVDNEVSHGVDLVVSNPPIGVRVQSQLVSGNEYLKEQFIQAKIPSSASESLWIQQALYQLNAQGKAYLLIIPGWLFRGGYDAELREKLVEKNLVESVTLLPAGTLLNSAVEMSILVLNKAKDSHDIRLVDGRNFGVKKRGKLVLTDEETQHIVNLINGHDTVSNLVKDVSIQEVRSKKYSLHCSEYFEHELNLAELDLDEQLKALVTLQNEYSITQAKLNQLLSQI
ncbi:SAM-dependent methyltransferase [Acinetobacter sp. SM34]|uniref:N-6 DNA methylase n=1 Tax=Acinetobacter sp. SM34 TaxID=1301620 RepID=UPI001EDB3CE8|nr:N-6 DNA methylase [Acinetobacter sp. SM34]MCG2609061.1 SAM-dependent methyltransferase [Acinetobacter sp. SM34]